VPGIKFGPDVVTWPALVTAFAEASATFQVAGEWLTECALVLESSEFGNLVNPSDRELIDLLVTLWDAKQGYFRKVTKGSGKDVVENPLINLSACTTPAWIAGNFPEYIIGGGFTSRCLFVYAEKKERYIPYPSLVMPAGLDEVRQRLIQDLEQISFLAGAYKLTDAATEWGKTWYTHHFNGGAPELLQDDRFAGYLARKQTHLHKTAMIVAASQRDELVITDDDLAMANTMITDLEKDMPSVFARIGRTEESIQAERFIKFVQTKGEVPYHAAYACIYMHFPKARNFEDMLNGAIRSGQLELDPVRLTIRAKLQVPEVDPRQTPPNPAVTS
jgi:hypothetical protein